MAQHRRKKIVIYGNGSSSGKTTLAESLLAVLEGWAAIKITPSPLFSSISLHDPSSEPSGKDSGRLVRAGADPVIHLMTRMEEVGEGLKQALDMIPPDRPLLIEGRGALNVLEPDLSILVWRGGLADRKGSLEDLAARAGLIFINEEDETIGGTPSLEGLPGGVPVICGCLRDILDPPGTAELTEVLKGKGIL
jgi:hypothetical protein